MTERAIFDLRLEIEAPTKEQVYQLATKALRTLQESQIQGVNARYTQMRPAHRSKTFKPTMTTRRTTTRPPGQGGT
jgi:hypothetical protein